MGYAVLTNQQIAEMIKKAIRRSFETFGLEVRKMRHGGNAEYGLHPFFSLLRRLDFSPQHIVDVGANRGYWTRTALEYFPDATYTLVEPQAHLKQFVQDLIDRGCKINWIDAGCSDRPGILPLNLTDDDTAATFRPLSGPQRTINVPVITLNELVKGPAPEVVKIDGEAFDLKILAGASNLFGKTEIFLVEVAFRAASEDFDNTITKTINFMDRFGYSPLDITDLNRSKYGILALCELAFLRHGSPLQKTMEKLPYY